ncbi:MAG: flagellin, partial [Actinomycetota bacterium]
DYSTTRLTFQVGANEGSANQLTLNNNLAMTSASVFGANVSGVDLTTAATTAISTLDAAISSVSTTRSTLGATQNRLEHTIANLQVSQENLMASESRIRDTDMADEMVNFTRRQIMTQAGTAMLAQANNSPQSVLSLL